MIGTSAKLREGDILNVEQLLYGLMLPSGNDAAYVLAKNFGKFLFKKKGYTQQHKKTIRSFEFDHHEEYVKYFLYEMNCLSLYLNMYDTYWDSPHGLGNEENNSTVYDLFILCEKAMQCDLFREIVSSKTYCCTPTREKHPDNHVYTWINNNRLLGVDGIIGIKTGTTKEAGHCLTTCYEKDEHNFIVVSLHSRSKVHLWMET